MSTITSFGSSRERKTDSETTPGLGRFEDANYVGPPVIVRYRMDVREPVAGSVGHAFIFWLK